MMSNQPGTTCSADLKLRAQLRKAVLMKTQVALNKKSKFSQHKSNQFNSDFSSEPPVSLTKKKNHFSCITRLKIHHQLENHCKELFSTELHWEIFCCITSYNYNNFQNKA